MHSPLLAVGVAHRRTGGAHGDRPVGANELALGAQRVMARSTAAGPIWTSTTSPTSAMNRTHAAATLNAASGREARSGRDGDGSREPRAETGEDEPAEEGEALHARPRLHHPAPPRNIHIGRSRPSRPVEQRVVV
jgi:hypothetical protein